MPLLCKCTFPLECTFPYNVQLPQTFLKATISVRRAEASKWWSMQIQNELIKSEHAQSSLWYLNSCLWNPLQQLCCRVMIYRSAPPVTAFHNTNCAQIAGGALDRRMVSSSCLLLALLFIMLSPCLPNNLFDVSRGRAKILTSVFQLLLLSCENETRYKILQTIPGLGTAALNWWFEHLSTTWENQQVWVSEVWQCWKW